MNGTTAISLARSALALALMSAAAAPAWAGSICDRNNGGGGLDSALGLNAFACGGENAASGDNSTAVGRANRAYGKNSSAFGYTSRVGSQGGLAIGGWFDRNKDGLVDFDFVLDNGTIGSSETAVSSGNGAVAVGAGVIARGDHATAYGNDSAALAPGSSAIGSGSTAAGYYSLAIGSSSGYSSVDDNGRLSSVGLRDLEYDETGLLISVDGIQVTATGEGMDTITHINGEEVYSYSRDAFAKGVLAGGALALGDGSIAQGMVSTALGSDSVAIGTGAQALGGSNVALGERARADGSSTTAVGYGSNASGDGSNAFGGGYAIGTLNNSVGQSFAYGTNNVAMGTSNFAIGNNNTVLGSATELGFTFALDENGLPIFDPATGLPTFAEVSNNVIAIGANDIANNEQSVVGLGADNAIAVGRLVSISDGAVDAIAIGRQTQVTAPGAVALGAGSVADRANTVSVGAAGSERQITNVADGVAPTDAVNRRQLDAQMSEWSRDIDQRIGAQGQRINTVGALSAALSMATPDARVSGANQFSMGVGHYRDQQALSVGYSRLVSSRTSVRVAAAFADGENAAGVGFNVGW